MSYNNGQFDVFKKICKENKKLKYEKFGKKSIVTNSGEIVYYQETKRSNNFINKIAWKILSYYNPLRLNKIFKIDNKWTHITLTKEKYKIKNYKNGLRIKNNLKTLFIALLLCLTYGNFKEDFTIQFYAKKTD